MGRQRTGFFAFASMPCSSRSRPRNRSCSTRNCSRAPGRSRSRRCPLSDELLPFYERELSFIRRLGARFAKENPLIAGRLGLGESGEARDPHVERMIEAFAYLNARTRQKLEDEFPELTEALLGVLYPHYQAPIPSLAIVQFELDPAQNPTTGHAVPRHAPLE